MRIALISALLLGLAYGVNAQQVVLTGMVYDPNGAYVIGANLTVLGPYGAKFEAVTNYEGAYSINLVPGLYRLEITGKGFKKLVVDKYTLVASASGKISKDFVIFGENPEPCGYGGDGCLATTIDTFSKEKPPGSYKIMPRRTTEGKTILTGSVFDDTGAVIANAAIRIRGSENLERIIKTNGEGIYSVALKPGDYTIQVSSPGFQIFKLEKYRMALTYEGRMRLDIVLEVRPCDDCHWIVGDQIKPTKKPK